MANDLIFPPQRSPIGHKGTYGSVLGIGGSRGMAGAVVLAGRAALLSGAGLVRLAVPNPILETVAGFYSELTTIPCPADNAGRFSQIALETLLSQAEQNTAIFIGPGLGRSDELFRLIPDFLAKITQPVVVDADALNALSASGLSTLQSNDSQKPAVFTPHAGEFSRLRNKPTPPEEKREIRIAAAQDFARQFGILLVLKGHTTIITDGIQTALNTTGNPGMATGGSGDVLTGMIAGLAAQNFATLFETVQLAVHLHGLAGDIAKNQFGEISLTATSILDAIPSAFLRSDNTAVLRVSDF